MRAAAVIRKSVVATAASGTMLVTVGAATADSVASTSASAACPSGTVCLYADPQFTGPQVTIQPGSAVPTFPPTFDNQMSAWTNNTTLMYCWWTGPNFTGQQFPMPPGTEMGLLPPEQDNQASSAGPC